MVLKITGTHILIEYVDGWLRQSLFKSPELVADNKLTQPDFKVGDRVSRGDDIGWIIEEVGDDWIRLRGRVGRWKKSEYVIYEQPATTPKEIELRETLKMLLGQYKLFVGPDDKIANFVISEVEKALKP